MRRTLFSMALLAGAVACHAAPWDNVPPLRRVVVLDAGTREIDYLREWTARAHMPAFSAEETPVLAVRARVGTPADAGCNFVLQVVVNGRVLTESPFHSRLLNKSLSFDPPGTDYHFQWYQNGRWMTIFSNRFDTNWGGSGHDTEFLFDLTGLVASDTPTTLTFVDAAVCDIAAVSHLKRAPLVIDKPTLGVLSRADADRLRAEAEGGGKARIVEARPELPADAKPGPRAYEVVWSGRPAPPAQVTFDDLRGWKVQVRGDATVTLSASVEQLLWRRRVGRFSYSGGTRPTSALIVPPHPITIAAPFDAVNLYLYGAFNRSLDVPVRVAAMLEDAGGADFSVDLGAISSTYWGLQHGVLRPGPGASPRFPVKFRGLALSNLRVKGDRHIYLDSMLFYQQHRKPPKTYHRPRGASFPTSEDGMLPTPPPGVTVEARGRGLGAELTSRSPGGVLRFLLTPSRGCLDGISAQWADGERFHPTKGGGLAIVHGPGAAAVPADAVLLGSKLSGTTFEARWREKDGPATWSATYRLRGRTLVVDLRCAGGYGAGVQPGRVAGLPKARAIDVPYLYLNGFPKVACGNGLFVSVLPDCYHSDFSTVNGNPAGDEGGVALLGGTQYNPLTDGRRLPLRDRWLITVSPDFAGTLPNTRNPVSPNRARLAPYMFFMADSLNPNLYRVWKRYGLDHVIANDFASLFVVDYAEGFSMRWRPHPVVGLERAKAYIKAIKDLGYLAGVYGDFCDFFPYNANWDENKVSLRSDGAFLDSWFGNFATKPTALPGLVRAVGRKCRDLYHPDCVYLDTHTCYGPVARDYEAGAAGAGLGWMTVLPNEDAIAEARKYYGSTISEGLHRWLYAGITDMDYATLPTFAGSDKLPPLVDFDLLKIHPYGLGTMMGYSPAIFLNSEETGALYADPGRGVGPLPFHKYVSASLAYGHMAMLGYGYLPPLSRTIQLYALMEGVQREYLTDTATDIAYNDGKEFVSTSRALLEDAVKLGRVRVRYSRGLTVYVNYNDKSRWTVRTGGATYELPPYGWVIEKPGQILAFSALVNGAQVDFVRCPDYLYLNTGSATTAVGPLDVSGAVWVKREGKSWRVMPCGDLGGWQTHPVPGLPKGRYHDFKLGTPPADRGCKRLVIDTQALLGKSAAAVKAEARDDGGRAVASSPKIVDASHLSLPTTARVTYYVLR